VDAASLSADGLRALLHAHLSDPDMARDLWACLQVNKLACDLLVTTDNETKVTQLRRALSDCKQGSGSFKTVSFHTGDSLQSLLTGLRSRVASYDVVGHIHDGPASAERNWRNFYWQNLLGGRFPMRDLILDAFAKRPDLGLVFPSDPCLAGWGSVRPYAEKLAAQLDLRRPVPDAFDFPSGTMFWMRAAVLDVLMSLELDQQEQEYDSTLTGDRTLEAALARMIPFVSQAAGLSQAVTHVPGITL
jgi:lipopolysaccharide biosynthesis protein